MGMRRCLRKVRDPQTKPSTMINNQTAEQFAFNYILRVNTRRNLQKRARDGRMRMLRDKPTSEPIH